MAHGTVTGSGPSVVSHVFVVTKDHAEGESCPEYGKMATIVNVCMDSCDAISMPNTYGSSEEEHYLCRDMPHISSHKGVPITKAVHKDSDREDTPYSTHKKSMLHI